MSNDNNGTMSDLLTAVTAFETAREAMLDAENALASAKASYSEACRIVAEAIPGDTKKIRRHGRELTFSKAGRGGGWSCRGLADKAPADVVDLG